MTATSPATETGLFARLRRFFSGGGSSPANDQSTNKSGASAGRVATDISAYAEVLGIEQTEPSPLELADGAAVKELAERVLARLSATETPPIAMPIAALRVINLVAQDEPDVGELSRVVSSDPAITAAVLRVATSALNAGLGGEQTTVRSAIARLGTQEVGRVAGAVAARSLFNPQAKAEHELFKDRFAALHHEAATCAAGAAYLAMQLGTGRSDAAYLGGMMHDIGKPVALSAIASMHLKGHLDSIPSETVIDAVLEQTHARIGIELHKSWGLPDYLSNLCAQHHDAKVPSSKEHAETHLVRVVAGLLALHHEPEPLHSSDELLQSTQTLAITPLRLRAIDAELRELGDRVALTLAF